MGNSSRGAPATSRHLEVERKFEVLDSTVTPSFDGLASIAGVKRAPPQMLHAVYYGAVVMPVARTVSRGRVRIRIGNGGH